MPGATRWKSRPVFITSTFLDMQDERDFLRNIVFPDVEDRLRARRHHLEWIDLRVGVANAAAATEEARELQVLKVCLAEVRRSRPFLIALIGDRYGWVPPEERIKAAAAEEGFAAEVAGRSVTDLEIDFGVLSDPEQRKRSHFYFREPLPYASMGGAAANYSEKFDTKDPAANERASKLEALKKRIREQFPDRVRSYSAHWDGEHVAGFDELRELVTEDLWHELEAETSGVLAEAEVSWQQAEREAVADFAEDRARDFVGRDALLGRIAKFAASKPGEGPWGLCFTGAAGAGKSALWGTLQARLAAAKSALVLYHAAGASQRASSVDAVLRRWIDELATDLGIPSELAEDAKDDDVEAVFALLLGRAAQKRRVLILVDALDQFEQTTRARNITWLPRLWPDNARLIATAIPGEASQGLLRRAGVEEAPLPPLAASEAREIIAAVCRRYHRTFEPQVIDVLVEKQGEAGPACGNPLWLTMAVEELNLLDADDFARVKRDYSHLPPSTAICALMCDMVTEMPADIPGLYAGSFDRAAALFGAPLTQAFLGAVAVSRGGWRESDFREVLPKLSGELWDELRFAQLRRLFRGQVRRRGALGQWEFAHGQMRPAAKVWLARLKAHWESATHTAISDCLLSLPADDPLHISETMAHLMAESGTLARARSYYGSTSLSDAEMDGATHVLAGLVLAAPVEDRTAALAQVLRLLDSAEAIDSLSAMVVAQIARRLLFIFGNLIDQRVELNVKAALFDRVKAAFERLLVVEPGNVDWLRDLSVSYDRIARVLIARGDLPEALKLLRKGLGVLERLTKFDPGNTGWERDLAVFYEKIGDVLKEQGDLPEALKYYGDRHAIADRLVKADPGNAGWQHDLAASYDRIGGVLEAQGNLPEALKFFRDSHAISDRLAKANPDKVGSQRDLTVCYQKIGTVLEAQGNLPEALKHYRDAHDIFDRLAKSDPGNADWQRNLAMSYKVIGDLLNRQGNLPEALKYYRDSHDIFDRLAKADPGNADWQRNLGASYAAMGEALGARGHLPEALKFFHDGLDIADRLAKADPSSAVAQHNLAASHDRIGHVLRVQGKLEEALERFRDSRGILDRLATADPTSVREQHDLSLSYSKIGEILTTQGNLPEALKFFRDRHAIAERLAKVDPSNADWQHDLAVSSNEMGGVLKAQGDLPEALKYYRDGHDIFHRLAKSDPGNTEWQRELAVSYNEMGGVLKAQGNLPEALKYYRDGHDIFDRLATSDPGNAGWQRDLSVSYEKIGDVLNRQGNLPEALKCFRDRHAIADRLAKVDPGNVDWQRDLAVSYSRIGDVQLAQGNLQDALKCFRQRLFIDDHLAKTEPDNAEWQMCLSLTYSRIGDVLVEQRNLAEAVTSFRNGHVILERLAKTKPDNPDWQEGLSVFYNKIGNVLVAQRNMQEAQKSFHGAHALFDRLASADPGNVRWQHKLAASYSALADAYNEAGQAANALDSVACGRAIITRLVQINPEWAQLKQELAWFNQAAKRICVSVTAEIDAAFKRGNALMEQGDLPEALKWFRNMYAIADRLVKADPGNVDFQSLLSLSYLSIGDVLNRQGNLREALKSFRDGQTIADRLVKAGHQTLQSVLALFNSSIQKIIHSNHLSENSPLPPQPPQHSPAHVVTNSAIRETSTGGASEARRTDTSVAAEVKAALDHGDAKSARELLYKQRSSNSALRNLLAVCHLRLGEFRLALAILRPMIMPSGGLLPSEAAESAWIINFATALILDGDIKAGRSALRWLKDPNHPAAVRLRGAMEAWDKSLGAGARFKRLFGAESQKSPSLDFPPGVY